MATIFVNTDNSDPKAKIYKADKAGKAAAAAEAIMQKIVKDVIGKAPGFTLAQSEDAKGYTIKLELKQVKVVGRDTVCKLGGEIVRYPKDIAQGGASKGETMVSLGNWGGEATASGTNDRAILQGVEAIAESMIPKSINPMKSDMLRR